MRSFKRSVYNAIAARQGVPLARSTLAEWIGRIGVALRPLADRLAELLQLHPCLQDDETPVRQLDPGSGKTKHAYLWAYRFGVHDAGVPILVFDYQTSRAGASARAFLHGWRGHLMVGDYVGYLNLKRNSMSTHLMDLLGLSETRSPFRR